VEFTKLRGREIERVKSSARGSAAWAASMLLYRELYDLPTTVHPYSRYDAMPDDLAKLGLEACKGWHRAHFVPSNAALVVAGDVTPETVATSAKKWFGGWKGVAAPSVSLPQPFPPKERELYLVDRPGSAQSQVLVGMLGPERSSAEWPAIRVANQILGGGVSGRLFLDVREKRSLAYSTGSSVGETRSGPVPLVLSAGTQTAKTADTIQALIENLDQIAEQAPLESELERAVRFLNDSFVFRLETVGSVADLTSQLYVLGLPDDHYDEYRKAVRGLALPQVSQIATRYYARTPVIVVAGDAAILGPQLAKFGAVAVLDPEQQFSLKKSYPKAP
jgi:predicted Zn-dependent peptidase